MKQVTKHLVYISVFAVAMGFLETAVVIYLRELYYPEGFLFPLKPMPANIALVELFREAATVVMLIGVGYLAGKTSLQRFAYFSLAFAVWDIFYYVFLYVFLKWPQQLATWDILFLLPMPWVGPVWAPCVLSLLMVVGSVFVVLQCEKDKAYRIAFIQWFSLLSGALICILAFMQDYYQYRQTLNMLPQQSLFDEAAGYAPNKFNTKLFLAGLLLMCWPVFYTMFNTFKIKSLLNR